MKTSHTLLIIALLLGNSFSASASLTAETSNGVAVVYDSGINAVWTADANLLGTLESQQGTTAVINAIIAANGGVIHDTPNSGDNNGTYTLSAVDFNGSGLGTATWWGAQAFVAYLNSIDYAGKANWALPSTSNQNETGYKVTDSQLGELFYNELGGTANNAIPVNALFSNEQSSVYWSGTEYAPRPYTAWDFNTYNGYQIYSNSKGYQYYAWAVSPGNVAAAVPVPSSIWLFVSGVIGLLSLKPRGNIG